MADFQGLQVIYQGFICSPLFEFTRSVGLEPDFGFVHLERGDLLSLEVKESLPGLDLLRATTREKGSGPGRPLLSSGTLTVAEFIDGQTHRVDVQNVLLSERAMEAPIATDDHSELIRVEITDIRYLYKSRGFVVGWVNVPQLSANAAAPTSGTQTRTVGGAGAPGAFVPGSLRKGAPWTVQQVIVEKILPKLPGAPRLAFISPGTALRQAKTYVWNGVRAVEALREILKDEGLVFCLNLDGSVSLWDEGVGTLQEDTGKPVFLGALTHDNLPPSSIDPRVAHARPLVGYHYVPSSVLVVGPPVLQNRRIDLEPVGEIGGQVVPLDEALAAIGITRASAAIFVFMMHHDRSALSDMTEDGLHAFEKWAFKWFRIPGLPDKNADLLPAGMRGSPDSIGQLQAQRVFCETHAVGNVAALVLQQAIGHTQTAGPNVAAQLRAADRLKAVVDEFQSDATGLSNYRVVMNLPYSEQAPGSFSVDEERGIVKFDSAAGLATHDGDPLAVASLQPGDPRVSLEFGYRLKPDQRGDLAIEHRYFSLWARSKPAPVGPVNGDTPQDDVQVEKLPVLQPGLAPLVLYRPEFEQVNDITGASNKAALDELAKRLAIDAMTRPQFTQGAVVEFVRPVPLVNTGRVLSIKWESDLAGFSKCTAHVGAFAPLSPRGDLLPQTRAFGDQSAKVDATYLPDSLRPGG